MDEMTPHPGPAHDPTAASGGEPLGAPPRPDDPDGHVSPPPPPGSPPPRRLLRDTRGAVLGGVAGGIGRHLGFDPVVVRLAFISAALLGGTGVLLYVIAWAIIPGDDEDPSAPADGRTDASQAFDRAVEQVQSAPVWVQITGITFLALLIAVPAGVPQAVPWALVLLAGGALLFRAAEQRDARADPSDAAPPPRSTWAGGRWTAGEGPEAEGVATQRLDQHPPAWTDPSWRAPAAPPPAPPAVGEPDPRPPSILGRVTVAVLLVAGGVLALLDQAGMLAPEPFHYAAGALVIVGLGLIVGTVVGRAWGLIGLGLALVPVLFLTTLPVLPLSDGIGERIHTPTNLDALDEEFSLGIGRLVVDLTEVRGSDPLEVSIEQGIGELVVVVPEGADVELSGHLHGGSAEVLGRRADGTTIDLGDLVLPEGNGRTVSLDIRHGLGTLELRSR